MSSRECHVGLLISPHNSLRRRPFHVICTWICVFFFFLTLSFFRTRITTSSSFKALHTYLATFFAPVALVTASPPSGWVFFRCYWLSIIYIVLLLTWLACCRDNHAHNGSAALPLLNPPLGWICEETANASSPAKRTLTTCILALQISQGIVSGSRLSHIFSIWTIYFTTRCSTLLSSMSSKSYTLSSSSSSRGGGGSARPGMVLRWYGSSSLTGNTLCFRPLYIFLQIQLIRLWINSLNNYP